jgi:hypothetical protein
MIFHAGNRFKANIISIESDYYLLLAVMWRSFLIYGVVCFPSPAFTYVVVLVEQTLPISRRSQTNASCKEIDTKLLVIVYFSAHESLRSTNNVYQRSVYVCITEQNCLCTALPAHNKQWPPPPGIPFRHSVLLWWPQKSREEEQSSVAESHNSCFVPFFSLLSFGLSSVHKYSTYIHSRQFPPSAFSSSFLRLIKLKKEKKEERKETLFCLRIFFSPKRDSLTVKRLLAGGESLFCLITSIDR